MVTICLSPEVLKRILEFDWPRLLEDIGFWMPANVNNTEIDDKPENAQELGIQLVSTEFSCMSCFFFIRNKGIA